MEPWPESFESSYLQNPVDPAVGDIRMFRQDLQDLQDFYLKLSSGFTKGKLCAPDGLRELNCYAISVPSLQSEFM